MKISDLSSGHPLQEISIEVKPFTTFHHVSLANGLTEIKPQPFGTGLSDKQTAIDRGIMWLYHKSATFRNRWDEIVHLWPVGILKKIFFIIGITGGFTGKFFTPLETGKTYSEPTLPEWGTLPTNGWPVALRGKIVIMVSLKSWQVVDRLHPKTELYEKYVGSGNESLFGSGKTTAKDGTYIPEGWGVRDGLNNKWNREQGVTSPLILIAHEIGHLWQWIKFKPQYMKIAYGDAVCDATKDFIPGCKTSLDGLRLEIHNILYNEAPIAHEMGEGVRFNYHKGFTKDHDFMLNELPEYSTTGTIQNITNPRHIGYGSCFSPKYVTRNYNTNQYTGDLIYNSYTIPNLTSVSSTLNTNVALVQALANNPKPVDVFKTKITATFLQNLKVATEKIVKDLTGVDFTAFELKRGGGTEQTFFVYHDVDDLKRIFHTTHPGIYANWGDV
jgi:hypothetical protein